MIYLLILLLFDKFSRLRGMQTFAKLVSETHSIYIHAGFIFEILDHRNILSG